MSDFRVEHIDHTGDAGLRVTASTLPRLFTVTAEQMVQLTCPDCRIRRTVARPVAADGNDLVELFINWLSEINSLMSVHYEIYGTLNVQALDLPNAPPLRVIGSASGEPIDPGRHLLALEIKAITFHAAYVRQEGDGWQGQVIFDL